MLKSLLAGVSALSLLAAAPAFAEVTLSHIGSIKSEAAGEGAAEIVDYDPASKRLFISNAAGSIDIVDITDPKAPQLPWRGSRAPSPPTGRSPLLPPAGAGCPPVAKQESGKPPGPA